jgi:endonuclease/exonuclease/phosphatase family metal-dependent hydrolase
MSKIVTIKGDRQSLRVVTWNVYKDNKTIDALIAYLPQLHADVYALQEVPRAKVESILELFPHVVFSHEGWTYKKSGEVVEICNVIASTYELRNVETFDISLASLFQSKKYSQFTSECLSATIRFGGEEYEIMNTHLRCVAPPWVRVKQFEALLKRSDMFKKNVICGDLNTFSWPLLNLMIGRRYSYSFKELFTNGRKIFEQVFMRHNLINPHHGISTFKLFPVQYDYILVDKEIEVAHVEKVKVLHGSDHYALIADIQ